jgi:hypothetical protein
MTDFDSVKDSGERRDFGTGSVRDVSTGKGRYDLLPPMAIRRLAQHYENGAAKYGDNNWKLGQPLGTYLDSGIRHAFNVLDLQVDEDHPAAVAWNLISFMWTVDEIRAGRLPRDLDNIGYIDALEAEEAKAPPRKPQGCQRLHRPAPRPFEAEVVDDGGVLITDDGGPEPAPGDEFLDDWPDGGRPYRAPGSPVEADLVNSDTLPRNYMGKRMLITDEGGPTTAPEHDGGRDPGEEGYGYDSDRHGDWEPSVRPDGARTVSARLLGDDGDDADVSGWTEIGWMTDGVDVVWGVPEARPSDLQPYINTMQEDIARIVEEGGFRRRFIAGLGPRNTQWGYHWSPEGARFVAGPAEINDEKPVDNSPSGE